MQENISQDTNISDEDILEEINSAIKKYDRRIELFDSELFKDFMDEINEIGEDLGKTLVFNYNGLKSDRKEAIINQMSFISGLANYISGMRALRENVYAEREAYFEAMEKDK
jgi:hypothetical protein